MLDPATSGHPLRVALSITSSRTDRIRVIDKALVHNGDRFKTTMRMNGKTWHFSAVIHTPAIYAVKILP